jgi:hypothetical protein
LHQTEVSFEQLLRANEQSGIRTMRNEAERRALIAERTHLNAAADAVQDQLVNGQAKFNEELRVRDERHAAELRQMQRECAHLVSDVAAAQGALDGARAWIEVGLDEQNERHAAELQALRTERDWLSAETQNAKDAVGKVSDGTSVHLRASAAAVAGGHAAIARGKTLLGASRDEIPTTVNGNEWPTAIATSPAMVRSHYECGYDSPPDRFNDMKVGSTRSPASTVSTSAASTPMQARPGYSWTTCKHALASPLDSRSLSARHSGNSGGYPLQPGCSISTIAGSSVSLEACGGSSAPANRCQFDRARTMPVRAQGKIHVHIVPKIVEVPVEVEVVKVPSPCRRRQARSGQQ